MEVRRLLLVEESLINLDGHFYVANDDYHGVLYSETGNLIMPANPGIGVKEI